MEKEGYDTVLAASSTFDVELQKALLGPYNITRVLDKKKSAPEGMVRVAGAETEIGQLNDFYIDRYEVTNEQYKKFIDSGGYREKKYWKHEFILDGKVLPWEKAISKFVDQTNRPGPSSWSEGDFPAGQQNHPVSGISWYEAAAFAEFVDKSLPTNSHWGLARGEATPLIRWPQLGGMAVFAPFSNFSGKGSVAVGSLAGLSPYGAYDMAGNVREWCLNETPQGRMIRGGAWGDNIYMFNEVSQAPSMDRSVKNGFRCALYPDPEKIPQSAFATVMPYRFVDSSNDQPVPDSVFHIYKDQFSYDKTPMNARVESRKENPDGWILERITFDAAYEKERMIACLFLPKTAQPPYQTVVYFPGSASLMKESSTDIESYYEFPVFLSYLVKNGRAVLYPIYKGTFERRNQVSFPMVHRGGDSSHLYAEYVVQLGKDFKRSIDYLDTRNDIDHSKIAYYGMSWGGFLGAILPAVEDRVRVMILVPGGLVRGKVERVRAEADPLNYVTHIKIPTLMLNGRYDTIFPYETSIKPLYDLLGTPKDHKVLKLYNTDHVPPRNEFVKETLTWLDRYLGPVNR
jgi:cephalosporin-C deacetylase-like acetyl esterase